MRAGSTPRVVVVALTLVMAVSACGPQPPDGATLLKQSSQRMLALKGFHFQMQVTGFTGPNELVQSAQGDAHPPDLQAKVVLKESAILLEVEVIFKADNIYLKSFTGGWQRLTTAQVAQYFDARLLFDQQAGLFAAMRDTTAPYRGNSEKVNGHDAYPVEGVLQGSRMHQLLPLIREPGSYHVTYWIESATDNLWRARVSGNLFDASQAATIVFDFTNHDHPVSVTPPPLG
jgi:lipoprotein LprG